MQIESFKSFLKKVRAAISLNPPPAKEPPKLKRKYGYEEDDEDIDSFSKKERIVDILRSRER